MVNSPQQVISPNSLSNKIKIIIKSLVVDIISIAAMLVISLAVLNYFNVLSVSKISPFLSFLPTLDQKPVEVAITPSFQTATSVTPTARVSPEVPFSSESINHLKQLINSGTVEQGSLSLTFNTSIFQISKNTDVNDGNVNVSAWKLKLKANNFTSDLDVEESKDNKIFQLVNGVNQPIAVTDLKVGDLLSITLVFDILNHNQKIETVIVRTGRVTP